MRDSGSATTSEQPSTGTADAMRAAAQAFLAALPTDLVALAQHPLSSPDRTTLSAAPRARSGVPLKRLATADRARVHALVRTALSRAGYDRVTRIIARESVLAILENNPVRRDPENYYVWIFGQPQRATPWGWKFEGHHVSLNFVVWNETVASLPTFFGANPAEVESEAQRPLGLQEDLARALLQSFLPDQERAVIFAATPVAEILTGELSTAEPLPPLGIAAADMTHGQRSSLRALVRAHAEALVPALVTDRMARIDAAGFDQLRFAWAGAAERRAPHYYRVSGPTFVIESANTQNAGNHVHSVWRDFVGDFGRDLLGNGPVPGPRPPLSPS